MKQNETNPTAARVGCATCAKQGFSPTFLILSTLFSVCLIVANLMEIKTVSIGPMTITAGVIVFPVSYIISDCIVEVYGFSRARFVIWLGFAMNLLVTLLFQIGLWLPGDAEWHGQMAMETVFGAVPRILLASFTAFLCGSMVNAYVMEKMKLASGTGRGFSKRAIISTIFGEGADSAIFFPIAFGGVLPVDTVVTLIITQTLLKTAYEIVILPVTIRAVGALRRIEARQQWTAADAENKISEKRTVEQ
ncbi:MAG: queuosine precursor transporter [Paramuribaculum sp.]|nr:queuosine precursor transporter [Paramuribaculum sp.]